MFKTKSFEIKDEPIIGLGNYDQFDVSWGSQAFIVLYERAIIVTNLTKDNCNKFECSWQRCWKNAFYQPNRKTFNCYTLILFSCGLIHFWEFCVGCYACNESPKVLNLQIIIYTTRLLPISRRNLSKGIRNDWRKSLFCRNVLILCQIAK